MDREATDEEDTTQSRFTIFLRTVIQYLVRDLCTLPFALGISFRESNETTGQPDSGAGMCELWMEEVQGGECLMKSSLAIETEMAENFVSMFNKNQTRDGYVWPPLNNTVDISPFKDEVLVDVLQFGSAMAVRLALQILGTANGRWGILWAAPYFALAEIGESFKRGASRGTLSLSESIVQKESDASIGASEEPLILILWAIMMSDSGLPAFEIPPPTLATKEKVRRKADEALRAGGSGLPRRAV